jgi:PKD repeat protein
MTATPDQLPRDGRSQSVVTVSARDSQGKPLAGQRVTLGAEGPDGTQLSQGDITTGADGRATFAVLAPASSAIGNVITVFATPVGGNFENSVTRAVTIALTGPANSTAPSPAFTVNPAAPEIGQVTTFDATATTDEGGACRAACTYAWDFDDGSTGSGLQVTHVFQSARSANVALTVTDAAGTSVTRRQIVSIVAPAAPTASVAVSPNPPLLNQLATFSTTATAAAGHSVTRYDWNFGDGTTATTTSASVTKTYTVPGTYVVTVIVRDDIGQTGAGSTTFTVGSGINATFTFSPTNPKISDAVFFNATSTTTSAGASITRYEWDFGDGSTADGSTASHTYGAARTYVVRLTVTDSLGRTATITQNVTVS